MNITNKIDTYLNESKNSFTIKMGDKFKVNAAMKLANPIYDCIALSDSFKIGTKPKKYDKKSKIVKNTIKYLDNYEEMVDYFSHLVFCSMKQKGQEIIDAYPEYYEGDNYIFLAGYDQEKNKWVELYEDF